MTALPVIVGMGGVNPAGRTSFHHGYRRLVIDALPESAQKRTWQSLAAMMNADANDTHHLRAHSLIRPIEKAWFDVDKVMWNQRFSFEPKPDGAVSFTARARQLPKPLPDSWDVTELADGRVQVDIPSEGELLIPTARKFEVGAAAAIPTGFEPGDLYQSRSHPRGLQLGVYAASDAIQSTGIEWQVIADHVSPDQISVYASSAIGQLDDHGFAGLLGGRPNGKRVTSKHLPLGLCDMPSDFTNAYVVGSVGNTGPSLGACATFLFNLRAGVHDIQTGRARVAIVGASDAPINPAVMEGFIAMGALCTDDAIRMLDNLGPEDTLDHRGCSRPFSSNAGFTIGEAAQFFVLMDDALALELGAQILGAVPDAYCNADGYKKSISSPGVGNYVTVARALASAKAIVGEKAIRERSFVHAHGTGTPQNRTTESHIFNEVAKHFGIEKWPVSAIKCFVGHSMAAASGDQMAAALGTWNDGIIPGITTINHIAGDVNNSHLDILMQHSDVGTEGMDVAVLNAKGFGGNNASAAVLAPHVVRKMMTARHGDKAMTDWQARSEATRAAAQAYDDAVCAGENKVIYRFDNNVLDGDAVSFGEQGLSLKSYAKAINIDVASPYTALDNQ